MELARLGELDPFGILSDIERGQPGTVELDLCAGGKIVSIELEKVIEDDNRVPIYLSLNRKEIHCDFILPSGRYFLSYQTDLIRSTAGACNRDNAYGYLSLESGHKYVAKTHICRAFCCRKKCMASATTWIEDLQTGNVALGSPEICP
jgi:hypothetical protein